jgi:transcriptional regulator with XRE-family HTH domain
MLGLEYIMKVRGLGKTEIGKMLGISRQSINFWFKDYNKIPKKQLPIISDILNVPQESLSKNMDDKMVSKVGELLLADNEQLFETLTKAIELKGIENVRDKLQELL